MNTHTMRTLLRNIQTGQYFQALDKWTFNPAEAHDFGRLGRAMQFAVKAGLPDLELILSFDDEPAVNAVMN
jgi:hypothetical protein